MKISDLTDEDILELAKRLNEVMAHKPVSVLLRPELAEAVARGITDGSNPNAFCTRAQSAVMTLRAIKMKGGDVYAGTLSGAPLDSPAQNLKA